MKKPTTVTGHPRFLEGEHYRLDELIGVGGNAVVYRAEGPNGPCAVKLRQAPERPMQAARFRAEPIPMSRIDHPGVVRVYETGETDGYLWIAMELFENGSLNGLVRQRGALDALEACLIMGQVLDALQAVHDAGFVHRDVKPANIFLDDVRGPVLGDFGVTKHLRNNKLWFETQSGQGIGTAGYRAPEQDADAKRAGPAADIYGVAATLYHLTTGRRPSLLYASEVSTDVLGPVPSELTEVIARATRFDPEERISSAAEMKATLERVRLGETPESQQVRTNPSSWLRRLFRLGRSA